MNIELSRGLSTLEFIRMYQNEAKTPLELALLERLNDTESTQFDVDKVGNGIVTTSSGVCDELIYIESELDDLTELYDRSQRDDMPSQTIEKFQEELFKLYKYVTELDINGIRDGILDDGEIFEAE